MASPLLLAVVNHVLLPARCPDKVDEDPILIQNNIVNRLVPACQALQSVLEAHHSESVLSLEHSLRSFLELNQGTLDYDTLLARFKKFSAKDFLVLYVEQQNAALIIRHESCSETSDVIFEVFEASPLSAAVLETQAALTWDFPGNAAQIPVETFRKESFLKGLALFLSQASEEGLGRFAAHIYKAGVMIPEFRDTANPGLIVQGLMPLLASLGSVAAVPLIRKRVRDEVNKGPQSMPWRRLPAWLVLRVAMQRRFFLLMGPEEGRACYKFMIAVFLANLLRNCVNMPIELTLWLRAKLSRRFAKLELDAHLAPGLGSKLFDGFKDSITQTINYITDAVEHKWSEFKTATTRQIHQVQQHASDTDLRLTLRCSHAYLRGVITAFREPVKTSLSNLKGPLVLDKAIKEFGLFVDTHFNFAEEQANLLSTASTPETYQSRSAQVVALTDAISKLCEQGRRLYSQYGEEMSLVVLNVFDLWVNMDRHAASIYPLLRQYHPFLKPELLDVIQVVRVADMQRLAAIQEYLDERCRACTLPDINIFSAPSARSFPVRYFEQDSELQSLHIQITDESKKMSLRKMNEFEALRAEYLGLCERIESTPHDRVLIETLDNPDQCIETCKVCYWVRQRRRMYIHIHEDYLSLDRVQAATTVFELGIQKAFLHYRNATWKIFHVLGYPSKSQPPEKPAMLIHQEPRLKTYQLEAPPTGITMASVEKSCLQTHYQGVYMSWATEHSVLLPLALRFRYYDEVSCAWVKGFVREPTFVHLCGITIPNDIDSNVVPRPQHPEPYFDGLSSYDIVANITRCPASMSPHEFSAIQRVFSGSSRRWLNILVELGASNLNFSTQDCSRLLSQLANQAGPSHYGSGILRTNHWVFRDELFCQSLAKQIHHRLRIVESNWRETHCMEMLVDLSLRLFNLGSGAHRDTAVNLLEIARATTLQWTTTMRSELTNTSEDQVAQRMAAYGLHAAILCRKTFSVFLDPAYTDTMSAVQFQTFTLASIALQQNLLVRYGELPANRKRLLIADAKLMFDVQHVIFAGIKQYGLSLDTVMANILTDGSSTANTVFSPWITTDQPRWITTTMKTVSNSAIDMEFSQTIHYNYVEGHLLLNGKSLSTLPANIREHPDVKNLFGNQYLRTWISHVPGMSHQLQKSIGGCRIHFGTRGERVIIRAIKGPDHWEFVPYLEFVRSFRYDLPSGLVNDCLHWLHLHKQRLEVRSKISKWRTRKNDWTINLRNRRATRQRSQNRPQMQLVDPESPLFLRVAQIFTNFVGSDKLMVLQPAIGQGSLRVEIPDLALTFFANERKLLQCEELRSEIDPNQDIGTLYGFDSKIVMRSIYDKDHRSFITPLGKLNANKSSHGVHVNVVANNDNAYGLFMVDPVLGRLTCLPEPRLLFSKALFHAYTSFPIPDPLTKRTGAEEAMDILKAAYCQPWAPLGTLVADIIHQIQALVPVRSYYPKEKRLLQTTSWNKHLPTSLQFDAYNDVVVKIARKSNELLYFSSIVGDQSIKLEDKGPWQLGLRAELRRQCHERAQWRRFADNISKDLAYQSRDRFVKQANKTKGVKVVLEQSHVVIAIQRITHLLTTDTFHASFAEDLSSMLQNWSVIGGFQDFPDRRFSLKQLAEDSIPKQWGQLVQMCRRTDQRDLHELMFNLVLLCFNKDVTRPVLDLLCAFARIDTLKAIRPPLAARFSDFKHHEKPAAERLFAIIVADEPIEAPVRRFIDEVAEADYVEKVNQHRLECMELAHSFANQWPASDLSTDGIEPNIIDLDASLEAVQPEWDRLLANEDLAQYVDTVHSVLVMHASENSVFVPPLETKLIQPWCPPHRPRVMPSLDDLILDDFTLVFSNTAPAQDTLQLSSSQKIKFSPKTAEEKELGRILALFTANSSDFLRTKYGEDLQASLHALSKSHERDPECQAIPDRAAIANEIAECKQALDAEFNGVLEKLAADDLRFSWLELGGLWPCVSPMALLEILRSSLKYQYGKNVKENFINYGLAITAYQRLRRIDLANKKNDVQKAKQEYLNHGHQNWEPMEYPDWLLLEIDSDILIRPEQVDVARAIISPQSGTNSVLQMNMGQGKTSVIMPMVAAVLGDCFQLLRLVVPKALLLSTAQIMQAKLGGLVGRELRHIPFSRRTSTTPEMLDLYKSIHMEMKSCHGIMLAAPEHVLSFNLSGLQHLADRKFKGAKTMLDFQAWLTENCRDVLDESDFTLAVKTQLIYPSGSQTAVDGHPHRWLVVQELLSLIYDYLPDLREKFPDSIEVLARQAGRPMLQFLKVDVEEYIRARLLEDICEGRTSFLHFKSSVNAAVHEELKFLLSKRTVDVKALKKMSSYFSDKQSALGKLLLVRGVLEHNILILCLKKRWNVQYGLHPDRDEVAVPFEAKGVPSEQAEYGHADVAIILTCLAFYFTGLNPEQLRLSLRQVLTSDDPSAEFDRWTASCDSLPQALRHWNVINSDDDAQLHELWSHLGFNVYVINHYMNRNTFPKNAKQFSIKLQASGWDLPLFSSIQDVSGQKSASSGMARTTGFSGTNDNKIMLPMTIQQDDLPALQKTNAEVLTYLLRPQNRDCFVAAYNNQRLSEIDLLYKLRQKSLKILLDAGAFILEMDNQTLVKEWLKIDQSAKAGLFFDNKNRPWIRYRGNKNPIPLLATPFAESLDGCLVYLDEAHTRGVDLKLPKNARGALTLALGHNKDHCVQAAMRLRLLASTQSLTFFAPPEVHRSIVDFCKLAKTQAVTSSHIVHWLLEQTCKTNEQLHNLYLAQGVDFCRRTDARLTNAKFLTDEKQQQAVLRVIQRPERQTLEELYGGSPEGAKAPTAKVKTPAMKQFMTALDSQRITKSTGLIVHSSAMEEVEQEREVEFQVEEERQIQKPVHFRGRKFPGELNAAIARFVNTGNLCDFPDEVGFENAFEALQRTDIGQKYGLRAANTRLCVSAEFMKTIDTKRSAPLDNYLRPVEWVLWNPNNETALIVIAEEAELLIPKICEQASPVVHLVAYSAPVTKGMMSFNDFSYFSLPALPSDHVVPQWLLTELGVFAGRLYLGYDECDHLSEYLRLKKIAKTPTHRTSGRGEPFSHNPASFLLEWLALRRKGQDVMHTPVGYLCQSRNLRPDHHFFTQPTQVPANMTPISLTTPRLSEAHDSDEESEFEDDLHDGAPLEEQDLGMVMDSKDGLAIKGMGIDLDESE